MSGLARNTSPDRPVLVLLSGLPGTGKSSFARLLTGHTGIPHVQTDDIRREIFPVRTYSSNEHQQVFEEAFHRTQSMLLSDTSVTVDATMLNDHARTPFYRLADTCDARLAIVQFELPEQVILDRLTRRFENIDPIERSEAGVDVYRLLKPAYRRVWRKHWRVSSDDQRDQALRDLVQILSTGAT